MKKNEWIHDGYFKVNKLMVKDGKFIKDKIPDVIKGYFDCPDVNLTSLEGGPKEVKGAFYCYNNPLISLEGSHREIGDSIYSDLKIEDGFINSGSYINNYFEDLLKYMIKEKIDLQEIKSWPKGFLTSEAIKSSKGLLKFNL